MTEFVEVKTQDLSGAALDWAVAMAEGYRVDPEGDGRSVISPKGVFTSVSVRGAAEGFGYRPSSDWNQGGPLIEKYQVLLTPPSNLVHRNFGSFDKRNGWYESGFWGSTIFGKERKHRRASFHHPDSPLIVAMRAIAQFELGDTLNVPKELLV